MYVCHYVPQVTIPELYKYMHIYTNTHTYIYIYIYIYIYTHIYYKPNSYVAAVCLFVRCPSLLFPCPFLKTVLATLLCVPLSLYRITL